MKITLVDGTTISRLPLDPETAAQITSIDGDAFLSDYRHPLPALTSIGGDAYLSDYRHPLPALTSIGGDAYLADYQHPLPALTSICGFVAIRDYGHPLPTAIAGDLPIPVIEKIDAVILDAIAEHPESLDMGTWHRCDTTHCRAGWAIHLAGKAGYDLENKLGSAAAGSLIYEASRPGCLRPDFFCSDREAFEDIKRCAAEQLAA